MISCRRSLSMLFGTKDVLFGTSRKDIGFAGPLYVNPASGSEIKELGEVNNICKVLPITCLRFDLDPYTLNPL
ncbi:MAG: hypothetical protein R3282_10100 [Rhodothermales bacterium]|nr:hypothetical protein [Rhodothermales bacterium]